MADDRTYIRVHDGMDEHPKIEPLSDAAFRLLLRSWFYCSRNKTDGRIADSIWKKRGTARTRHELLDAGLAEQCCGHVQMHDYTEHQRTAEEIGLLREVRGDNGSFGNHVRWHVVKRKPKKGCEHCYPTGVEDSESVANAIANGSQERSQTDRKPIASTETEAEAEAEAENLENSSRGGSHVSSGSPAAPPLYSDRCARHGDTAEPGNCGACKDARLANATRRPLAVVRETQHCWVHELDYVKRCNGCEADRKAAPEEETA